MRALRRRGWTLAAAESLTGGLLGARLTGVPGASEAFRGAVVTYVDDAKRRLLGVDARLLAEEGAVSPGVAAQMAQGCRRRLDADLGVALTGIAGPNAPPGLPVGLVFLALDDGEAVTVVERRYGRRGRAGVREASVRDALAMVLARVRAR